MPSADADLRLIQIGLGAPQGLAFAQLPQDDQVILVDRGVLDLLDVRCADR